ncbi:hypothetical protein CDD80_5894 [Ophiocordyceps camponoti-rufipedis]|uniref:Peptidase S8/S53 domain-containing protein n=1 Tax=Ophiocordyceps camponoti-rufipedis TaxID=2004952 RepID=A0A2C5YU99_9HYPO|nr:hypothetical protein CDD80_5894 [Ophiocordyceps camponoti-rufipedis]
MLRAELRILPDSDEIYTTQLAWRCPVLSFLALAGQLPSPRTIKAPLHELGDDGVPGHYMVKLNRSTHTSVRDEMVRRLSNEVDHLYESRTLLGFAGQLDEQELEALRYNEHVEHVYQDGYFSSASIVHVHNSEWGLARISQKMPRDKTYSYDASGGNGTCVYVLDSGIEDTHHEFGGRAKQIKSFVKGQETDGSGHGTIVAGIIGSNTFGVARQAQLLGVKITPDFGDGRISFAVKGFEFVGRDMSKRHCPKGVIVNFSAGTSVKSQMMERAAAELVQEGVFFAAAAGNQGMDARNSSPSSEPSVCVVGGIDHTNRLFYEKDKYRSNYGPRIDVFAPAQDIRSTFPDGEDVVVTGTSVAAPFVAGLAAYLGALEGLSGTEELCSRIRELSIKDAIVDIPEDTPNRIAYNGIEELREETRKVDEAQVHMCINDGFNKPCTDVEAPADQCVAVPSDYLQMLSSLRPSRNAGTCDFYLTNNCQGNDKFRSSHSTKGASFAGLDSTIGLEVFNDRIRSFRCDGKIVKHGPHSFDYWAWSTETQQNLCSRFEALYAKVALFRGTMDTLKLKFEGQPGKQHTIVREPSAEFNQWQQLNLIEMFASPTVEVDRLRELRLSAIKEHSILGGDEWGLQGIELKARCAGTKILVDNHAFQTIREAMSPDRSQGYEPSGYIAWRGFTNPDDWKSRVPCSHLRLLHISITIADENWAGTDNTLLVGLWRYETKLTDKVWRGETKTMTIDPVRVFGWRNLALKHLLSISIRSTGGHDDVKLAKMTLSGLCSGTSKALRFERDIEQGWLKDGGIMGVSVDPEEWVVTDGGEEAWVVADGDEE